jgi:hypothetical protein
MIINLKGTQVCQLFKFVECFFQSIDFAEHTICKKFAVGVLDKDPTVWLDGARPANTCLSPSFVGHVPT